MTRGFNRYSPVLEFQIQIPASPVMIMHSCFHLNERQVALKPDERRRQPRRKRCRTVIVSVEAFTHAATRGVSFAAAGRHESSAAVARLRPAALPTPCFAV